MTGEADAFRVLTLLVAVCEQAQATLTDLEPPADGQLLGQIGSLCASLYGTLEDPRFKRPEDAV